MSTHVIAPGDTFWTLSQRYGCTIEAIMGANPGVVPEQLQIGQVIQLPGGNTDSSRPPTNGPLRPTRNPPPNARMDTVLNARVPYWCEPLRGMINSAS
jgi:murein DD-endopeptidase MepM/ murein hydrolase activator NlpD